VDLLRDNCRCVSFILLKVPRADYYPGVQKSLPRFLAAAFCLIAILLGASQAWIYRDTISSVDAVSYLDVADAYRHGRWSEAVNGYWNPLYSWILAIVLGVARPSPEMQYQVVKLVDWTIYLLCLFSFTWFLGQLRSAYHGWVDAEGHTMHIPDWVWVVAGYTLFIWSSLKWITLSSNTPDMAGAALCYAAWGLLIRVRRRELPHRYREDVLLGLVLALTYFARTPMFVVGAFIVLWCGNLRSSSLTHLRGALATAAIFLVLTAPYIEWISRARGHLTIGDNGWLNHAWLANPGRYVIPDTNWQGGPDQYGTPIHPTRLIWTSPFAYEFAAPIGGTFPPWTDPSYWYQGLTYHFDRTAEWTSLTDNVVFFLELLGPWLLLFFGLALTVRADLRKTVRGIRRAAPYWVPAAVGLGLYLLANDLLIQSLPTQPPERYVGTFAVLFCLTFFAGIRLSNLEPTGIGEKAAGVLLLTASLGAISALALQEVDALSKPHPTPPWRISAAIRHAGVVPDMRVAIVGNKALHEPWARLDQVHVVAQVEDDRGFWAKHPKPQEALVGKLAQTGADVIVASRMTASAGPNWIAIEDTGYAVRFLGADHENVAQSVESLAQPR
jgi:hypothetical protein